MKSLGLGIIHLALLTVLFACGKNNESGKRSNSFASPFGMPINNINSPYNYGGLSVNQVIAQNPCLGGFNQMPGYTNQAYTGQRIPVQVPVMIPGMPVIPPNDIYVGVTSYGDVGVLVGQAVGQPPLFVGYMCPRSFVQNGQPQIARIHYGAYSKCLFKPITVASLILQGGATAEFRWLDGGSSMNQRFTFCAP